MDREPTKLDLVLLGLLLCFLGALDWFERRWNEYYERREYDEEQST